MLTQDQQAFSERIRPVMDLPVCAIDTEFVWRKTYAPRIGLIQIAAPGNLTFAIDPLTVTDPTPLVELLANQDCLKVFHACSQDLEVLYQFCGQLPDPLFDTQIAGAMLDMGYQIGYAELVNRCLDINISKSQQFTDWCHRPLTVAQLEYAAKEVSLLLRCYDHLLDCLRQRDRLTWAMEDAAALLTSFRQQVNDPPPAWRRIRGSGRFNARQLGILNCLAEWRSNHAESIDKPPRWILDDKTLVELARSQPSNCNELLQLNGIDTKACQRWSKKLLECVAHGRDNPVQPTTKRRRGSMHAEKQLVRDALDRINEIAKKLGVATEVVATKEAITSFIRHPAGDSHLTSGWRSAVIGEMLREMVPSAS